MNKLSKEIKDLDVSFELVKGKISLLEHFINIVLELELELNITFKHSQIELLAMTMEIVEIKQMIRILSWMEISNNTKKFNLK